jgi:AsmA protein
MMRRALVILFEALAVCVFLVAAGLFWAAHYIDTPGFRQEFVSVIEDLTGRDVDLKGDLDIVLYPYLSMEVKDLSLSGKREGEASPLVRFRSLLVSVRLLPLLSKQVEIRTVVVRDMEVNLVRFPDGDFNWQDLTERTGSAEKDITGLYFESISVDGLEVSNATVRYTDEKGGQRFGLSGIDVRTGTIVSGGAIPFTAKSGFEWMNHGLESDITLTGVLMPDAQAGNLLLKDADVYATIGGAILPEGTTPGQVAADIDFDWENSKVSLKKLHLQFLGLSGEGSFSSGNLDKEISGEGHLTLRPFKPVDIISRYFPKAPVKSVDGLSQGAFTSFIRFDEKGVTFKDMAIALDDMTVRGAVAMHGYDRPSFSFDMRGNMVDLDRYLPLFRTDTPFVWSDFHLDFLRAFRGSGKIRADGFKVLDTVLSDIRLTAEADGKSIKVDAEAVRKGQGSLGGKAEFVLGMDGKSDYPTLGMTADLTAESLKSGFEFLNTGQTAVTGKGLLKLGVRVPPMPCPPDERSIGILGNTKAHVSLHLGAGQASFADDEGKTYREKYKKSAVVFSIAPLPPNKAGFGFTVDGTLKAERGRQYDLAYVAAKGPVHWDVDAGRFTCTDLSLKTQLNGRWIRKASDRLTVSGLLTCDSGGKVAKVSSVTVRMLETMVHGDARIDTSGKSVKVSGKVNLPGANVHHLVYLLADKRLDLEDPQALKNFNLTAGYVVSETGFTLSDVSGELDGMPFSGLVVGQGLEDPKLTVSLKAGSLDIDRYLPRDEELTVAEKRAGKTEKKAPPVDLPLAFLRSLRVDGKVSLEEFKLADVRATSVTGVIQAEKGDIKVTSVKGKQYGGRLTAEWTGRVGLKRLTTHLVLGVKKMRLGELLDGMTDHPYIKGQTDLHFDLTSYGATDDDIVKNLDGVSRIVTKKGSFKFTGYDVAEASARAEESNRGQVGTDRRPRRTVFDKAEADFVVKKGVFTAKTFRVHAPPLLQSHGSGWFSLPDDRIKLSIRNDFVAVPSVTIDIVGKLSDPEVKVPKGKIVNDTVRNILSLPEKSFKFLRDLFM